MTMLVLDVTAPDERRRMRAWFRRAQETAAKGFTLIELMIVLTIVGVVVAYAIPVLSGLSGA